MKKISLLLSIATATLLNGADINIKQGWQLLGTGSSVTTMENFKKDSIKTVWRYDSQYNRWSAFSPDEAIVEVINNNSSIANLHNIPQNSGFWVNANGDDTITIDESKNIEAYNLKKGWQLLGTNRFFDMGYDIDSNDKDIDLIWRYDSTNSKWMAWSEQDNIKSLIDDNPNIDGFGGISSNQGFWVLANTNGNLVVDQIKNDVQGLQYTTEVATVSDAKNMFTQLREAANSLYNEDNSQDQTTIIGQQSKLITDKIEPAVENVANNLDSTVTALENSFNTFDSSIEGNFDSVMTTVFNRLENLESEMNIVENGNTTTITFNGATIVSVDGVGENDTVTTTGNIVVSGTNYNLTITDFDYDSTTITFKANGTITGLNNSSMTLDSMNITFDIDHTKEDTAQEIQNIEIVYDGTIISNDRSFRGQFSLSESNKANNKFVGTFTGASSEPSFEGIVSANVDLDNLKELDNSREMRIWSNALITLTDNTGKTEFVTKSYGDYQAGNISLDTQDFNANCTTAATYISEITKYNTSCTNYELNIYNTDIMYDKIVKIDIDGQSYFIPSVWYNNTGDNDNTYYQGMYIGQLGYIDFNPNHANYNSSFSYANFRIEDVKSIDDFNTDIAFDGTITHGTKQIKLTLGAKTFESNNLEVLYGKNIEITDSDSFVKVANLQLTKKKNIDEDIFGLIDLQGFAVSIKDADGNDLTIDANISANDTLSEDNEIYFDGVYSYNDTTFTGKAYGAENSLKDTQSFDIEGSIVANGFEPFGIKIVGASTSGAYDIYGMFTRGSEINKYKLGVFIDENQVELSDSNGVMGIENDNSQIIIQDKDGNDLATYGENSSGNTWEINYTDDTSETLF